MLQEEKSLLFSYPKIFGGIVAYFVVVTIYSCITAPRLPVSIPWLGYGKGWIAGARNLFAIAKSKEWMQAGYERYSKNNKAFVLPSALGMVAEIVMPRSQMRWMLDQPDSVLSAGEAHRDALFGDYTFVDPIILRDPYHDRVVHKNLGRSMNGIISGLAEEVPAAVEAIFGTDTEVYTKVDAMDSFMRMVPRLVNRMLVGRDLCRNQGYLDAVLAFTHDVVRTQMFMFIIPNAFHPFVGTILGWISKHHYWLSSQFTIPMIKTRLEDLRKKDAKESGYDDWGEPQDYITWTYRTAQAEGRQDELRPDRIAKRIMPLNFASIHTTSLTAYEAITRILCADPSVLESLREEAHRIFQEEGGWTKRGLNSMYRMDSAIRESQRTAPISLTFAGRKVIAKDGIVTPDGLRVPYGATLSFPWMPVALDEDIHKEDAAIFDAFRYSRARETYEMMTAKEKEKEDVLKLKQMTMVTTSDQHLPFGHGRHACPGRFFVSHELKMIFAHLILNYDFKRIESAPKKMWVVRVQVPMPAILEAKRRKAVWQP